MKTEKLILNYQRRGIKLSVSDNKLHFSAPQNILTDEDKDILKKNKKEIIKFLLDHTESEIIVDEEDKYEKFPLTDIQLSYLVGQDNVYKFGGTNCKIYTEIEYEQIELNKAQYAWEQVIKYNDMLHAVINQEGTQEILSSYTVPQIVFSDLSDIAANLKEDANIMLRKFEQTFAFKQLKEINETEKREYQKKYAKVNNVKKEDDKYKDVLLLGATGFLGIYLLHQLLLESVATITLLIRADSMRQAQNRIKKHYEYYFGNGSYDQYSHRIKIIIGDLTLDMFGLTENEYKELANHIEAIINSAALVKHMGKNSEFELINVKIVENIVDFAKNGINKDIHHMSTIGIVYGANMEKSKTIFTEYDESTLDGLENQYLRSKVKAEKVLKNAKNQGVQSSIYRMSGILFDSKTGKYQINVNESSAYIYYRNLYRLRIVPSEIQRKMDISCVDKISEAVVKLILSDDSSNDVYHVINPNGLTIKEILNCFKDCENNKDIIMKELSVEEIYNYYKKTDTKEQELFKQLVFECEIVNDIGKCDLNIGVDRTIFILEQLGFKWEKVGREEIIRAYHAIRESKKSGKKQY